MQTDTFLSSTTGRRHTRRQAMRVRAALAEADRAKIPAEDRGLSMPHDADNSVEKGRSWMDVPIFFRFQSPLGRWPRGAVTLHERLARFAARRQTLVTTPPDAARSTADDGQSTPVAPRTTPGGSSIDRRRSSIDSGLSSSHSRLFLDRRLSFVNPLQVVPRRIPSFAEGTPSLPITKAFFSSGADNACVAARPTSSDQ
jgi:hypothetical protein